MSETLKWVCPICSTVQRTQVTTTDDTASSGINYRTGEKCKNGCYGRKANQAPKVRREKK